MRAGFKYNDPGGTPQQVRRNIWAGAASVIVDRQYEAHRRASYRGDRLSFFSYEARREEHSPVTAVCGDGEFRQIVNQRQRQQIARVFGSSHRARIIRVAPRMCRFILQNRPCSDQWRLDIGRLLGTGQYVVRKSRRRRWTPTDWSLPPRSSNASRPPVQHPL